jgi:hypothetical protein
VAGNADRSVVLLRGSPTLPPHLTTIKIGSRPCSVPVLQINAGGSSGIAPYSQRGPEKNSSTAPAQQEQSDEASVPHLPSPFRINLSKTWLEATHTIIVTIWTDDIVAGVTVSRPDFVFHAQRKLFLVLCLVRPSLKFNNY